MCIKHFKNFYETLKNHDKKFIFTRTSISVAMKEFLEQANVKSPTCSLDATKVKVTTIFNMI